MAVVIHAYRPKRSRKRKAQAALNVPAIVTARKPGRRAVADVPDMTPEEHRRRGDAADALFREMKRQIAASKRS